MEKKIIAMSFAFAVIIAVVVFFASQKNTAGNSGVETTDNPFPVNNALAMPKYDGSQAEGRSDETQNETNSGRTPVSLASSERLPTEQSYLKDGGLDIDVVKARITGKDFSKYIDALEIEMQRDPNASELARVYKSEIEKLFERSKANPKNSRFACGTTICIGSFVEEKGRTWYAKWWKEFDDSPATPHALSTSYTVEIGGGEREHRYLFTTDPATSEIIGRQNPKDTPKKKTPAL